MTQSEPLIDVSVSHLVLTMSPLLLIACGSWYLELNIESPILVGTVRSFIQLSILSLILDPIFTQGIDRWWLVVGYAFFMLVLAAFESTARSGYYFPFMFWYVLGAILVNVTLVSLFAFGLVIQPTPLWDPQYVIPIVGMLLGNCINGVSLSLNAMLTSFAESSREVELLLCFGANSYEASGRILREAIRTGTMPQLNGMAIIGIISIPGMMTGQILAGSTVRAAAHYQILIIYLIAICSFGTILSEVYLALHVCFDSRQTFRTDQLQKRRAKPSVFDFVGSLCTRLLCPNRSRSKRRSSSFSVRLDETSYLSPQGELTVKTSNGGGDNDDSNDVGYNGDNNNGGQNNNNNNGIVLSVKNLSYAFDKKMEEDDEEEEAAAAAMDGEADGLMRQQRVLFRNVSFQISPGGTALVGGPSGVGKSTMLRVLAGLTVAGEGTIKLDGRNLSDFRYMPNWRKQVLYVPQTKVDIPGTPSMFVKKISSFKCRNDGQDDDTPPSYNSMKALVRELIQSWGMEAHKFEMDWTSLSGGESQRMIIAIGLATRPKVIMLDESTSALDAKAKLLIEQSVRTICKRFNMCAIWITHDENQQNRMDVS